MEGLSVGAKIPSPPGAGKEGGKGGKGVGVGVEGGGVGGVGGGGGSGSGVGGKDEVWDEERLCEGLRRLEEMHNKVLPTPPPPKNKKHNKLITDTS